MDRWKRAVIHLECATDSKDNADREESTDTLQKQLEAGEIEIREYFHQVRSGIRDLRFHGTAIFFEEDRRRYLITARHVLWDETQAQRNYDKLLSRHPASTDDDYGARMAQHYALNTIFHLIFRVPSLDELQLQNSPRHCELLMNLGSGPEDIAPFTLSTPEYDLAVISLDQRNGSFANELLERGYMPVTTSDLTAGPSAEGAEVFTVGYPGATTFDRDVDPFSFETLWSSACFSLPAYSFGRVSMLHDTLHYFWADITIYPGNSGGPVVQGDKLVGVVSEQATIGVENGGDLSVRIPFGKMIKAQFVRDLVSHQYEKDERRAALLRDAHQL